MGEKAQMPRLVFMRALVSPTVTSRAEGSDFTVRLPSADCGIAARRKSIVNYRVSSRTAGHPPHRDRNPKSRREMSMRKNLHMRLLTACAALAAVGGILTAS